MNNSNGAPASLLRRNTGKRLSMASATRSSIMSRNNLIDTISTLPPSVKRRSLLSTPASRRQSSMIGILSSSQQSLNNRNSGNGLSSVVSTPNSQSIANDSRPLKDKNYQILLQNEVYEFLSTNKFELETNHPLTTKTLRQPTQKDFIVIFQFLYNRIDPFYRFTKSIETEVFMLLKILDYPYLDGINRSQISAVGGTYWPTFLGMLYWLVKLNLKISELDNHDFLDDAENPSTTLEDQLDQIFVDYTKDSYTAFIHDQDDFSEFFNEMKLKFNEFNIKISNEVERLNEINQKLSSEFEEVKKQAVIFENAEKKSRALENDLIKFKAYIETMESRKMKWSDVLDKVQDEINHCEQELSSISIDKQKLENQITSKNLSVKDIDNLNQERDRLSKSIDQLNNRTEEIRASMNTREIELRKHYQSLENFVKQYNNMIYKITTAVYATQSGIPQHKFEIEITPGLLENFDQSFTPNDILNKVLKDEKIQLLKFRGDVNSRIHQYQDESIKLQEQNDIISESIMEQKEEMESLEAKLSINKSTHDELYETMINDSTTYSMQIERLGRELRSIKINTNQEFIEVENRFQNVSIAYDELNHEILKARNELHDSIQKIIENTINFKLNIQQNLEDLEVLVVNEYEKEQQRITYDTDENVL